MSCKQAHYDVIFRSLQNTLDSHGDRLAVVSQKGVYAAFRYLPQSLDVRVSADRERARAEEEEQKRRLRAQAEASGKSWSSKDFKSK